MEKQNKDLIIQDLKDVIVDLSNKNKELKSTLEFYQDELIDSSNHLIEFNNDIGIQQRKIEALQLENSEVNKLLKFRTKVIDYVSIPYFIVSVIYIISNLIK